MIEFVDEWAAQALRAYEVFSTPGEGVRWTHHMPRDRTLPTQGWKVHVSSAPAHIQAVFEHLHPLLRERRLAFKHAADGESVVALNSGRAGATQVGKVFTIYCCSDEDVRAVAAHALSSPGRGASPGISADRAIDARATVGLRYGAFADSVMELDAVGQAQALIQTPAGAWVKDERSRSAAGAPWMPPSPVACQPVSCGPRGGPIVCGAQRYVPLALLGKGGTSQVHLAIAASEPLGTCVIKRGLRGHAPDADHHDAVDRLRRERGTLEALRARGCDVVPRVVNFAATSEDACLVMEDVDGEALEDLDTKQRLASLPGLVLSVRALHHAGYVHNDLKLENALRTSQQVSLIDLELAFVHSEAPPPGGTPGYAAPASVVGFARDWYAVAGCLVEAALGSKTVGRVPEPGRWIGLLQLEGYPGLARAVRALTCAAPETYGNSAQLLQDLAQPRALRARGVRHHRAWASKMAHAGALACQQSMRQAGRHGWWATPRLDPRVRREDLVAGAAGMVLGLACVDTGLQRQDFQDSIVAGCQWLADAVPPPKSAGLFTGNAGVALVLAVMAQRTGRDDLHAAARRRLRAAVAASGVDPDLYFAAARDAVATAHAQAVLRSVYRHGRTSDGTALMATVGQDEAAPAGYWCAGVTGYLWAATLIPSLAKGLQEEVRWAARASLASSLMPGCHSLCHGLAGQLEAWRALRRIPGYAEVAEPPMARVHHALQLTLRRRMGQAAWTRGTNMRPSPEFWTGTMGPAACLALGQRDAPMLSAELLRLISSGGGALTGQRAA